MADTLNFEEDLVYSGTAVARRRTALGCAGHQGLSPLAIFSHRREEGWVRELYPKIKLDSKSGSKKMKVFGKGQLRRRVWP